MGNHLVGTVLGTPETQAVGDARASADFVQVSDLLPLPSGDVLVADAAANRVFRVGVDGLVRPWAGDGSNESNGDGAAAINAGIPRPMRLATDGAGKVFVAHFDAQKGALIRQVDSAGGISAAITSTGPGCPAAGDARTSTKLGEIRGLAVAGQLLYFAVGNCPHIYRVGETGLIEVFAGTTASNPNAAAFGGATPAIPAGQIVFGRIVDIAADNAGNLLVADAVQRVIVRITPAGIALRVAGPSDSPTAPREGAAAGIYFTELTSLAVRPNGTLVVSQSGALFRGSDRREIGLINLAGNYNIVATGDGPNTNKPVLSNGSATVFPRLVRTNAAGATFLLDARSNAVLQILDNGSLLPYLGTAPKPLQIVPNGTQPFFETDEATNLAADSDSNLHMGAGYRLYRLSPEGALTHIAGNGEYAASNDGLPPLETSLRLGAEIAVDAARALYWNEEGFLIRKLTAAGVISGVLGGGSDTSYEGKQANTLNVQGVVRWAVAGDGAVFFIAAQQPSAPSPVIWRAASNGVVTRYAGRIAAGGSAALDGVVALDALLTGIEKIAVSPNGTLFFRVPQGIFRVDDQGAVRLVANGNGDAALVDGAATPGASALVGASFLPQSATKLLLSAGNPRGLAEYTTGGSVTVWRAPLGGAWRNDGGLLKDDQFADSSALTVLPGGALAWMENHRSNIVVRRSFPVPNGCTYTTSASEIPVSGGNVLTQVTLTTGADCPWTVGSSANWLETLSPRFGKGPVTLNLRALANPSPSERTATLRVAGKEVLVRQASSTLPNVFVVSPVSATVPPTGGSVEVTISASPGLPWQVALPSLPITIAGPSAGTGSASFVLTLEALPPNLRERTAVVVINDKSVTLRQVAPATPVTVTVNSVPAGSKATIDLVERTLPYMAQWVPGSYHFLQAAAFTKVNDNTLVQFQTYGTADNSPEQIFVTPPTSATLTAQYRRLHLLRARPLVQTLPSTATPLVNFEGIAVPQEFAAPVLETGAFAKWYPEGRTVRIFAREETGLRFVNFTGGLTTTENPTVVQMAAPATITANYAIDLAQQPSLTAAGNPRWWFYGASRAANAAQVAVTPSIGDPQPEPGRFVQYHAPIDSPEWLTLRPSNAMAPFSLEVGVDAARAADLAKLSAPQAHRATVFLHRPGMRTASFLAEASVTDPPAGNLPWISALTDAGGFRQSVDDGTHAGLAVSPGMILTAFGLRFASQNVTASALPLPTVLDGVSVEAQESGAATWTPMPLFFVSPTQINFQVLPSLFADASGKLLRFRVRAGAATVSEPWNVWLNRRSVSLFSADSSGAGAPAGFFVRVLPNQTQQRGNLFQCVNNVCTVPITAFGGPDNDLFLELFGTGFREPGLPGNLRAYIGGRPADIAFAGPHPVFVGLDQLNIKVPRDIAKGQSLDLYVWVRNEGGGWIASNRLSLRFE